MKKTFFYKMLRAFVLLCVVLFLPCCANGNKRIKASVFAPPELKETDLVGIWEAQNTGPDRNETLTLSEDHHFKQLFRAETISFQNETEGTWELIKSSNGCTYLFLYGMKYFHQDAETAANGNRRSSGVEKGDPIRYWDECSQNEIIMPDMVKLLIMQFPDEPRNIILQHMSTTREMTETWFVLSGNK